MDGLLIRPMRPDEISIAVNRAATKGWNPGLTDAVRFAAADPQSCDRTCAAAASGCSFWNAAIARAGPRVIGLDGVAAQQQKYRKSGFEFAYANVCYGGTLAPPDLPPAGVIALSEVPLATGGGV